MLHRVCVAAIAATGLCAVTGCAASSAAQPVTARPLTSASASIGQASHRPGGPDDVVVNEQDNHKVVRIGYGSIVTVILHSTYWRFGPPPSHRVLALFSAPGTVPRPPGAGGCVPGQGCGTVTVAYRAIGPGSALIRASRASCGEAMRCTGGQGTFIVTVVVKH